MVAPKVWFITGASSGFGRSIVKHLLEKGELVVATLRKPEVLSDLTSAYPATRLVVIKLDVTQPSQVVAAFQRAKDAFGRIDVVFNNAGVVVISEVEGTSDEAARKLFEVNFWGALNVSKEAVKFFREVNQPAGGKLLQVSSKVGLVGTAGIALYSATKFALEGLSEGLAKEVHPSWNIQICIIEPGPFRTKVLEPENLTLEPAHPAYTLPDLPSALIRKAVASGQPIADGDTDKAVKVIYRLASQDVIPLRFPLHRETIEDARAKGESLIKVANDYAAWSEGIYFTE